LISWKLSTIKDSDGQMQESPNKSSEKNSSFTKIISSFLKLSLIIFLIGGFVFGGFYFFKNLDGLNPSSYLDEESDESVEQMELDYFQDLNIKLIDLESPASPFEERSPVSFRGYVVAEGVSRILDFDMFCELEDNNQSVTADPPTLTIYESDQSYRHPVSCLFEEGVVNLQGYQAIQDKFGKLIARYTESSQSKYEVYVLSSEAYDSGKTSFGDYGINPSNIFGENKIGYQSVESGPLEVEILVDKSQPFKEGESYLPLIITLVEDSQAGNLYSLNNLNLKLSSNIELSQDSNFCDFEFIGYGSDGYATYSVKQDIIDKKVNEICSYDSLLDLKISEQRCIEDYKKEIIFKCDLITKELYGQEGEITQNNILVGAEYLFEIKNLIRIPIKKV